MGFAFGEHSTSELAGVHEDLVEIVELAIRTTSVDFTVHDGIRVVEEQRQLVSSGASFTMRSLHLPGKNGKGRAVDLVPFIAGKLRWDWPPIFHIAGIMRDSALSLGRDLRWGGAWDMLLTDPVCPTPEVMMAMYLQRRTIAQERVFLDGPHYELLRSEYPDATPDA